MSRDIAYHGVAKMPINWTRHAHPDLCADPRLAGCLMERAKRRTLSIGPIAKPLPKGEHETPAECGKEFDQMMKDAGQG